MKQNEYKMRTVNMTLAAMGIGTLKQHVRISKSKNACQGVVVGLNCLFEGYEANENTVTGYFFPCSTQYSQTEFPFHFENCLPYTFTKCRWPQLVCWLHAFLLH